MLRSTQTVRRTVTVIGANSRIGQPLSLLLTLCPHVTQVRCCDASATRGIVADLSHIDVPVKRRSYAPSEILDAVKGSDIVLYVAPTPVLPVGAEVSETAMADFAKHVTTTNEVMAALAAQPSRSAVIGIVSNSLNVMTPLCAEMLKSHGHFDPRKLCGVTTPTVVRARTLVARLLGMNPFDVNVPVVGGDRGPTRCLLIAQTGLRIPYVEVDVLARTLQEELTEWNEDCTPQEKITSNDGTATSINLSDGGHSLIPGDLSITPLSVAYAVQEWATSIIKALRGDSSIIECTMVESTVVAELPFFSSRVEFDKNGVKTIYPIGAVTPLEQKLVDTAVEAMKEDVSFMQQLLARKN